MKNQVYIFLMLLFTISISYGQNADIEKINKKIDQLRLAILTPNEAEFKKVFHPKITYGHSNGLIENQEECIKAFLTGPKYTKVENNELNFEIIKKTAIVRGFFNAEIIEKDKPARELKLKILMVFVKQKNDWLLLTRQGIKLP
jgi:uncharacterized protein YggL (DUF469 family)